MSAPTLTDAVARSVVRLPDGRTARLVFLPTTHKRRCAGAKARVVLPSGRFMSIEPEQLDTVEDPT